MDSGVFVCFRHPNSDHGCFNWDSTDLKHPKHLDENPQTSSCGYNQCPHSLLMLASQQVQSPSHLPGGCRTLWCTCDPHFGCMKPVGLRLSWWIQLSPQQMNPRCHERTCKVIHFAQTAKIFICTWKNLTKNSKVRNGQWSHAAISCSTCDYIPSFKGMPILNVGSISCPVPCHLDQGKAPGKLANWQKYTHTKTGHLGDAGSEITWSQHVLMRDS